MTLEPCKPHGVRGCLACVVLEQERTVLSESDPTKSYTIFNGCTCPDFYHKYLRWYVFKVGPVPNCKHVRHALRGEGSSCVRYENKTGW